MLQQYCPQCGQQALSSEDDNCFCCRQCDFEFFRNVAAAVGVVLVCNGCVLIVKRCKAPAAGEWDLPGGFVNPDESAEQALRRECYEETGILLSKPLHYLGAWPNRYPYKGLVYPTMDIFFTATLTKLPECLPDSDEVSDYQWKTKAECAQLSMAFPSAQRALKQYLSLDQDVV